MPFGKIKNKIRRACVAAALAGVGLMGASGAQAADWCSGGVWVVDRFGVSLGLIPVPELTSADGKSRRPGFCSTTQVLMSEN